MLDLFKGEIPEIDKLVVLIQKKDQQSQVYIGRYKRRDLRSYFRA